MGPECQFVFEHYNDYISGELDEHQSVRIERHIEHCGKCELFLGKYSALHMKTVKLLRVSAPSSLKTSISELMAKI